MLRAMLKTGWMIAVTAMVLWAPVAAQEDRDEDRSYEGENFQRQDHDQDNDRYETPARIDRYLDVQVWPNRDDGEYYAGDNIVLNFRANRDCFVAIYSVDSRGRVNLLFPSDPSDDNFITGGVTYKLPSGNDRYDLVVNGPNGRENIQMVASRERFPIPNWFSNSGLIYDGDDRDEYMDGLNSRYFVRYPGQRFAFDRAVVFVSEWEPSYYRPVYSPYYPDWAVCGNVYIDYPWGGSIYIDGIYWGVAPLYVPRLVVGWHVITVYDPYNYCWESDFHVNRYHTVVFDHTIVKTTRVFDSRYKQVRISRWRDPVRSGYPDFKVSGTVSKTPRGSVSGAVTGVDKTPKLGPSSIDDFRPLAKKYVRGDATLMKTDRGYETRGEIQGVKPGVKETGRTSRTAERNAFEWHGKTRPSESGQAGDNSAAPTRVEKRKTGDAGGSSESPRIQSNPTTRERAKEQPKAEPKVERSGKQKEAPAVAPAPRNEKSNPPERSREKGDSDKSGSKGKRPR
ncbi:MAG: DUF4384 domain-containing protein [candidate division Zixibacteria bacterium]|nr:DUF4384 domain-containing protein [candidate division Zixibacteria bacterium]